MPKCRQTAHGDEALATRQEPNRLVINAHVEINRPEAVLLFDYQDAEGEHPDEGYCPQGKSGRVDAAESKPQGISGHL
ncbi:hypothetical protein LBMAG14_03230 [Actinomycetes bacterium]|nr:hypothetical protein LBMAG14_03230 [Actinomycetes bacterium]